MKNKQMLIEKIVELWELEKVPEIKIVKYDRLNPNHTYGHWHYIDEKYYYRCGGTNPVEHTAYHIVSLLPKMSKEVAIIYKLYAYAYDNGCVSVFMSEFVDYFKQLGTDHFWWTGNSKYVLPSLQHRNWEDEKKYYSYIHKENMHNNYTIIMLIKDAAKYWTALANDCYLLLTPDLMDNESPEYKNIMEIDEKEYEKKRAGRI